MLFMVLLLIGPLVRVLVVRASHLLVRVIPFIRVYVVRFSIIVVGYFFFVFTVTARGRAGARRIRAGGIRITARGVRLIRGIRAFRFTLRTFLILTALFIFR